MYPSAITYGIGMNDVNFELRDRLSRVEGKIEGMESRIEFNHADALHRVENTHRHTEEAHRKVDENKKDMQEVKDFLATVKGHYSGAKWAFIFMGSIMGLGLISVTFGG